MIVKAYDASGTEPEKLVWEGDLEELLREYQGDLTASDVAQLRWLQVGQSATVGGGFRVERVG